MKYTLTILLIYTSLCSLYGQPVQDTSTYGMYPNYLVGDTLNGPSSGQTLVPVRYCLNNPTDSQQVYIEDLPGLKYNEFKHMSFRQFNDSVVSRIVSKKCLDFTPSEWSFFVKISNEEYRTLKPDSLLKKYFTTEQSENPYMPGTFYTYGEIGDYKVPTREVLVAFVILMDNRYVISLGCHEVYSINKAPSDNVISKCKEILKSD